MTVSELGRRTVENGNRGLDHCCGNVMLVAGAGVKGGAYYIDQTQGWPRWPTTWSPTCT